MLRIQAVSTLPLFLLILCGISCDQHINGVTSTPGGPTPSGGTSPTPTGGPTPVSTDPPSTSITAGVSATLQNGYARLDCDLQRGVCTATDRITGTAVVVDGSWRLGTANSTDSGYVHTAAADNANDAMGQGKSLVITSALAGQPTLVMRATYYTSSPALTLAVGLTNSTMQATTLTSWAALTQGQVMPRAVLQNPVTLNGAGGGRATSMEPTAARTSTNNIALTWTDATLGRRSLVAGGLTYQDFVKTVSLAPSVTIDRQTQLAQQLASGGQVLAYLDAGAATSASQNGVTISMTQGVLYSFGGEDFAPAFYSMGVDGAAVRFSITGLTPGQPVTLGFSWWDYDNNGRVEAVYAGPDINNPTQILAQQTLPEFETQHQPPQQYTISLPPATYASGSTVVSFVFVTANKSGSNAVVSEVWLGSGAPASTAASSILTPVNSNVLLELSAVDPVGHRVDPGETYTPQDAFYLDVSSSDPFESLEAYGQALRTAQGAKPNPYDFLTVDSWYAGVYNIPNAQNGPANSKYLLQTTAGMVTEMGIVKQSGFLSYGRAVMRMVPDLYASNNMNGWYDDAHYAQYGFFTAPYTTAASWVQGLQAQGGLAGMYMQPIIQNAPGISLDYRQQNPTQLLGGDATRSLDYTNPATQAHMAQVFGNFKTAGILTLMIDYCDDLWVKNSGGPGDLALGGFHDTKSTAGNAYRQMFIAAKSGMGAQSLIQERGIDNPGSDISAGLVDSQRIQWDNTITTLGLVAKGGVRWYKNRVVYNYDMDARDLLAGWMRSDWTGTSQDGWRMVLTTAYVASSRLLLGNSFRDLPAQTIADIKKVFPYHSSQLSARPVDAFKNTLPWVYDLAVNANWHQVMVINNTIPGASTQISVPLSGDSVTTGALGLDAGGSYYAYDFWNDAYLGKFAGSGSMPVSLRSGEAKVFAMHRVETQPQFVATDRHIMQGYVDLSNVTWNNASMVLSGTAQVVGGVPYIITFALNGFVAQSAQPSGATLSAISGVTDVKHLTLQTTSDGPVAWSIQFTH